MRTDPRLAALSFRIGPRLVGAGGAVYVIAEAGVNHDGDLDVARDLVAAAAHAGADAVKFQVFTADRLVTRRAPSADYQRLAGQPPDQFAMLARLELKPDHFAALADAARTRNIDFLATPFSVPDLLFLLSLRVPAVKLASTDIVNAPLLDAASQTGLPVLVSTGAADLDEIQAAVRRFSRPASGPLALLHCVSSYPTPEDQANLAAIATLADLFHCVVGFSDHTESVASGACAVAAGARIIEKHLTLDRRRAGPDHAFSLEPHAMAEYVRSVRHAEKMLGDGRIRVTDAQREIRRLARGSVVAAGDIPAGRTIRRHMLTVKRPGTGISPMEIEAVVGRSARRAIPADTVLSWKDVQ